MTGWIVTSASASGWRRMCSSPRRAMTQTSASEVRRAGRRDGGERHAHRRSSLRRSRCSASMAVAGERQEHVVQRRLAQAEVLDLDAVVGQRVGKARDRARALLGGRLHRPRAGSISGSAPAMRATWPRTSSSRSRSATRREQLGAAHLALERPGVAAGDHPRRGRRRRCRRRGGRPPPGTGSSAGSWCPRRPASSSTSQSSMRARGSRPVVGSSRNSTSGPGDERRRQVEAAAHAARVRLRQPVGRRRRARTARAARRRGRARRCARGGAARRSSRGSRGRSAARPPSRPARRGRARARTSRGVAGTSSRPRSPGPRRGRRGVVRMRTAVVLPAPFGPSRPQTVPARDLEETPSSAVFAP